MCAKIQREKCVLKFKENIYVNKNQKEKIKKLLHLLFNQNVRIYNIH